MRWTGDPSSAILRKSWDQWHPGETFKSFARARWAFRDTFTREDRRTAAARGLLFWRGLFDRYIPGYFPASGYPFSAPTWVIQPRSVLTCVATP